ncbi:MAG: tetraacyldisaccharide 4'-kinase [Deltaproteobacteria bacterium]
MSPEIYDLLAGQKHGLAPALARVALRIAALFYGLGIRVRNGAYDRGWKKSERAALPVVSLGNLTTGGTGKTPFAAFVARWFRERGIRVCFISRGYRADQEGANDEALVLDQLCPDVPHLQNPDRVAAARVAQEELGSQLIILDDGFQHRRLARDLDIVLIDATNPWGFGHLLPRGLLREPVTSLKRADLVVITRVDQVAREVVEEIRRQVASIHPDCGIAEATFRPVRLIGSTGKTAAIESLCGRSVAAFCGIGNPAAFRAGLEKIGWKVADFRCFPDHHNYTRTDVRDLERWSGALSVDAVVCTQKDLVKIGLERFSEHPLWAVEIGTQITAGAGLLEALLQDVLQDGRRNRSAPDASV